MTNTNGLMRRSVSRMQAAMSAFCASLTRKRRRGQIRTVVGLKHIAAFGALEGDFFETIVKPSHDPSSALQPARLLIGRSGAAGGSKERKAESWQAKRSLGGLAEPRTSICAWVRAQLSDRLSVRRVSLPPPCGSTITAASSEH